MNDFVQLSLDRYNQLLETIQNCKDEVKEIEKDKNHLDRLSDKYYKKCDKLEDILINECLIKESEKYKTHTLEELTCFFDDDGYYN